MYTYRLVSLALVCQLCAGVPIQDSPRQRLLNGLEISSGYNGISGGKHLPFTPGHRDPYDHPVDSVGDEIDPLPWRNGNGASVLGPWNRERSRQSPDLVRPPSTDHGNMANMRWSFADSHMRIEVRKNFDFYTNLTVEGRSPNTGRWMDAADHYQGVAHQCRACRC